MGVFDGIARRVGSFSPEYGTLELDEAQCSALQSVSNTDAIRVRPYKNNDGIARASEFLESIHDVETTKWRGKNVSSAHAFELRYADERVNFQFVPGEEALCHTFERQLQDKYPDSQIETSRPELVALEPGKHVAASVLELDRYSMYPIKHPDLEGFDRDPFGSITSEMVGTARDGEAEADVVVQVIFRPAKRDWVQGVAGGESIDKIAKRLKQPTYKREWLLYWYTVVEYEASDQAKRAAKIVRDQHGERGWHVNVRVLAVSDDPDVAIDRVSKASSMFRNYYESSTEQRFVPQPQSGRGIEKTLNRAVAREWVDRDMVKSESELAGLAHIPNDSINTQNVEWTLSRAGDGIPPGTPRFDFDAAGVAAASQEEKQLAMIDASGPGDPLWFGWGSKNDIEAGVFEEFLNAHMQVTGATRMGKTSLGTNVASQVMGRDQGTLIITLGKQDDDEKFIAEWPDDRPEEDFVFIDTGDDFDKRVRFNLLEIPDELEPGTTEHTSYTESLADEFCAAFAQAGGDGESLYPLMRGITRTLVRGMSHSGKVCTPIDLAAACAAPSNMSEFSQWMSDERIHFVEDTARRFAEEKDDADLEPIARRMDEITHNGNLRDWLAAREPTVRIQDIVNEGKVAVLRIDPALGETERKFAINPVVRRFAHAKKMAYDSGTNTDPFYFIWDEADKAVTIHSNVGEMLSEFGGYGARFCLMYQAPSYQLPKQLKNASEAQIDNTFSYRTKGDDARFISKQHSEDIDAGNLRDLPRYSFYMNTDTKEAESTHSYRVDAFPPVREVRERVDDHRMMTDDEIREMKRRSVELYGGEPETAEQIKSGSHFFGDDVVEDEEGESGPESDDHRNKILKAVYDESIRQGNPGGWVSVSETVDRLDRYLDIDIPDRGAAWRDALQSIPDSQLNHRESDEMEVKALDTPFMNLGQTQNDGSAEHWAVLSDAYVPLTQSGFTVEILAQDGDDMPDAIATLEDVLSIDGLEKPGEIADAVAEYREENPLLVRLAGTDAVHIESEHTTGSSQPSQTVRNLAQAHNEGRRCLFVCREDVAERVHSTLVEGDFGCRASHSIEGERRFYTATTPLRIDDKAMTRLGGRDNVWIHTDGEYQLRDTNGTIHARFDAPEAIFEDADAYPEEGDRNIMPPVIPEYEFDDPESVEWDIIVVKPEASTPMDLYHYDGEKTPLPDLVAEETTETEGESESDDTDDDLDEIFSGF